MNKSSTTNKYSTHYVAFLDVLGFKDMINNEKFDQIFAIFVRLQVKNDFKMAFRKAVDYSATDNKSMLLQQYNLFISELDFYVMSDSIAVSIPASSIIALQVLLDACLFIQQLLYNFKSPVLLRGAVTVGDYYVDGRVAFGKALVDAYVYSETYCKYPRIIVSGDIAKKHMNEIKDYLRSATIIQDETDKYYYIDCIGEHLGGLQQDDIKVVNFRKYFEDELDNYPSPSIREKYLWVMREVERVMQ